MAIRRGAIYHFDEFPDVGNEPDKRRYAVVLGSTTSTVTLIGISATTLHPQRVDMPNAARHGPDCTSGLPRECWAVPDWIVRAAVCQCTNYQGFVSSTLMDAIIEGIKRCAQNANISSSELPIKTIECNAGERCTVCMPIARA